MSLNLTIGAVAKKAGVNVETIRYYQRLKLLEEPPKPPGGVRRYSDTAVSRVQFIKRAQELGFSLDEVEELLRLRRNSGRNRVRIRAVASQRIEDIEQKIAELERMKRALASLVHACREGTTLECPIIEALTGTDHD